VNLLQRQSTRYFEALDLATTSICNRFDQKGFKVFSNIQQLLFKACSIGQSFSEELNVVCGFFCNDFSKEDLSAQLLISPLRAALFNCER